MGKRLVLISMAIVLVGCGVNNQTHNLSKGNCREIACVSGQCQQALTNESMTQTHCQAVGGAFESKRLEKKRFWF